MSPNPDLVPVRLVPVETFGGNDCCQHGQDADCPSSGYGLMDAVQAWSDCNRAIGRTYRIEDLFTRPGDKSTAQFIDPDPEDDKHRTPGQTLVVWVPRDQLDWFLLRWNTQQEVTREHVRGETLPVGNPE